MNDLEQLFLSGLFSGTVLGFCIAQYFFKKILDCYIDETEERERDRRRVIRSDDPISQVTAEAFGLRRRGPTPVSFVSDPNKKTLEELKDPELSEFYENIEKPSKNED